MGHKSHSEHNSEHEERDVETVETVPATNPNNGSDLETDVASDPALDDRLGSDWIDEGGATSVGPATSTPGGVETEQSKRQVRIDRERDESKRDEREKEEADEFRGEEDGDVKSID